MSTALLTGGLLMLALAQHPFVTYPLSLLLFRRTRRHPAAPAERRPTLALCMCAHNEAPVVVAKVERMLEMARLYGPATVHVYADAPSDGTAALLAPYADRIDLVVSDIRRGKTAGMNLLVARSAGELIAFTDANVEAPVDALVELARPFDDPGIGCTSAQLVYSNAGQSATAAAGSAYWAIEERVKQLESETFGMIGVDGALFMARRHLYQPAPDHLIDDLYVSLGILLQGYRAVTVEHVIVRERSATGWREEYRRKRRIACQAMNVHAALWPKLRRGGWRVLYPYISHRLLKWLLPFTLSFAGVMLLAGTILRFGWSAAAVLGITGAAVVLALALLRRAVLGAALSAASSLAGVGVGALESWFLGRTYVTWNVAASVRG